MANVTEEQKNYIIRFYKMMTAEFITRQLGIARELVYQVAEENCLRKEIKPVSTSKPKADLSINVQDCIPLDPNKDGVPFVIDQRTTIIIPRDADPEERRKMFLRKIKQAATSVNDILMSY